MKKIIPAFIVLLCLFTLSTVSAYADDTQKAPSLTLDTTNYTVAVNGTYDFIASTNVNDTVTPIPESSDLSVAQVSFVKKVSAGKYLYKVTGIKAGTALVGASVGTTDAEFGIEIKDANIINISPLLQKPELSSGCEITALTNLLNFYGYGVSKTYMADNILRKDNSKVYRSGKLYMANPANIFVGDPRDSGFGCYAQPIVDAANRYLATAHSDMKACNVSGTPVENLYNYVANNSPVLVWGTMNMADPTYDTKWYDEATGNLIQWIGKEHCLLLVGFNSTTVTVSDPLQGITTYQRAVFEQRYAQVNKQAVIMVE